MSEETKEVSSKHLSARELLRNKGIYLKAWNEWEESSRTLPKTGAKQFEPDGSWLQNKQIENGVQSRKFLIGIERVERLSRLASAEWLPEQKKARVTKKSGHDWAKFGLEVNGNLYLIPEEALILLETECLELTWEGVPVSIQHAYDILIESEGSDCTMDEYRVYSQLTRLGYHLQRFCYEKSQLERAARSDESIQRKKVLVDPENGMWMSGNNTENKSTKQSSESGIKSDIDDVKEIIEEIMSIINDDETEFDKVKNGSTNEPMIIEDCAKKKSSERKGKNGKVEIISEQKVLTPIRIRKDGSQTLENSGPKWPGARIQRNVKLLPKRNDKSLPATSVETPSTSGGQSRQEVIERIPDKRKNVQSNADSPESKKSKHEVIDLSDDEIEEIPRPMTRMEMLNYLPNIASQVFITENISRRYIPRGIRPQRTYRYDSRKLRRLHDDDKPLRRNLETGRNGLQSNVSENVSPSERNSLIPYQQYSRYSSSERHSYPGPGGYYPRDMHRHYIPHGNQFTSNSAIMNMPAGVCMHQDVFENVLVPEGWRNPQNMMTGNRWSSFQMNFVRNAQVMGYSMRSVLAQSAYFTNTHQNMAFAMQYHNNRPHRYLERPWRGSHPSRPRESMSVRQFAPRHSINPSNSNERIPQQPADNDVYKATFTNLPGTSSWPELKQKWRDAKTITIDDEDSEKYDLDDSNEIQVVDQTVQPLIGSKFSGSFSEIFERLRIIKSAPERTVRRKKSDYKISYNVYSSTQNYRKANPGLPMYHLVVTSKKENDFLQPVEVNRLQQDGKGAPLMFAHVSNCSIAYLQPGIISLPNLH